MNYDRIADIPIRHRFVDYVCTVGYSEYEGEFGFIAARYADPNKKAVPKDGFSLYLRLLKEPALCATVFEALLPAETSKIFQLREEALVERAKNYGFLVGFLALCVLGYLIHRLTIVLASVVEYSTAEAITYLPMFFAVLIIFPVQHFVERWYMRRYCSQHGHRLENFQSAETEVTWCKRCGLRLVAQSLLGEDSSGKL